MKRNIQLSKKTILVTGAAGFIGANLVRQLLSMDLQGTVIGIDNMNDYYDVSLKFERPADIGTSKPRYDLCCQFMCQEISKLRQNREEYFNNFNPADDDIIA